MSSARHIQSIDTKLIIITGQTASGKSELALKLAQQFNGEIICADSRTIYRYMDIGTAKPTVRDREFIKHYLLDVLSPDKEFNSSDFKNLAKKTIGEINSKGKVPFIVGGTGLYIDSVLYNFKFGKKKDKILRTALEKLSDDELRQRAERLGIAEDKINFKNRRHLMRAIERGGVITQKKILRNNTLVVGLKIEQEMLKNRIKKRVDKMVALGLEKEVRALAEKYSFSAPGMNAICYKEWEPYFAGEQSLDELKQKLYTNNWQYARRQKTWFKRDLNIRWVTSVKEASVLVEQFLIQ